MFWFWLEAQQKNKKKTTLVYWQEYLYQVEELNEEMQKKSQPLSSF